MDLPRAVPVLFWVSLSMLVVPWPFLVVGSTGRWEGYVVPVAAMLLGPLLVNCASGLWLLLHGHSAWVALVKVLAWLVALGVALLFQAAPVVFTAYAGTT